MKIPLEFITLAHTEARMYRHATNHSTFIASLDAKKKWGNDVVYGALFLLRDFDFYIRTLDAYHGCSLSVLLKNHSHDISHRVIRDITPITFSTLDDFCSLKYEEKPSVPAYTYFGNPTHPKIKTRLHSTSRPYRIVDGINKPHFKELLREVL